MVPLASLQHGWHGYDQSSPFPCSFAFGSRKGISSLLSRKNKEAVALGTIPPKDKVTPLIPSHNVVMNRPLLRKGKPLEIVLGREIAETMI